MKSNKVKYVCMCVCVLCVTKKIDLFCVAQSEAKANTFR